MRLFTHWKMRKLRREERKFTKESDRVWAEAVAQEKRNEIYGAWYVDNGWRFDLINAQIKETVSKDLIWQAERLLLPTPDVNDKEKWIPHKDLPKPDSPLVHYYWVLTPNTMAELTASIREERKARLDIWESRAKIAGVIITGLTGIIGTIIGLVAI